MISPSDIRTIRKPDIVQYLTDYGKAHLIEEGMTVKGLCIIAELNGLPWRWDEDTLTREVAKRLTAVLHEDVVWTHNPMGEKRNARTGAKLKAFGVRSSWPDTTLAYRMHDQEHIGLSNTLHIELKSLSTPWRKGQKELAKKLEDAGHDYVIVRSLRGLERVLGEYFVPLKRGVRL